MASPQGEDMNYAGPYIHACWALTGIAAVALIFRYVIKTWIRWTLPRVGSPERVWGAEDLLYAIAYGFDIAHMVFVQRSYQDGLGRHMWFLSNDERKGTLKNEFTSQPLGFNSTIDFFLTIISAVQLWRFTIRATDCGPAPRPHLCARIRKMPKQARIRRVWQTVSLSGPLLLSGIASIVKTYLLKSIGDKNDITHNIIPFILWVKIENYSILFATLAPIIRLCVSMVSKDNEQSGGYWSHSGSKGTHPGLELGSRPHTQSKGAVGMSVFDDDDDDEENVDDKIDWNRASVQQTHQRGNSHNKPSGGVTIRTDIVVRVSSEHSTERLVV
ncbi:hypothetical protein AARAC_000182 [Aspergillus arachidicola]|uniref:Integral membrane protein n=1 Tax=Aspergillus arachidicola TaxID=656916 RepID=A0A2G7FN41_9EURO|nr:hypothetical protein AARAC_000182 [Aspergillus arachidicola]